jgi:predicted RecB family nuclease
VLKKVYCGPSYGSHRYEPTIIVGTHQILQEQKLAILFVGYVLGKLQNQLPATGVVIGADGRAHKVDMESANRILIPMIKALRQWTGSSPPPPVLLNKHCPTCQFRNACMEHAEKVDDLSLLDRVTPKIIQRYQ